MKLSRDTIGTRTIQKVRIRILPFVFLSYVIAILDRINIGFVALTMNKELGITSQQFGLLVGIFFLGYFIFRAGLPLTIWTNHYWSLIGRCLRSEFEAAQAQSCGRIRGHSEVISYGRKNGLSGEAGPGTHLVRSKILFLSFGAP